MTNQQAEWQARRTAQVLIEQSIARAMADARLTPKERAEMHDDPSDDNGRGPRISADEAEQRVRY